MAPEISLLGLAASYHMHIGAIARFSFRTLVVTLPGLAICRMVDRSGEFTRSTLGGAVELLLTVSACAGLLGLAAVILLWKKPTPEEVRAQIASGKIEPSRMPPVDRAAFYAVHGSLPKWLHLPFLSVGVLMTVLAALSIVGMIVWMVVTWPAG